MSLEKLDHIADCVEREFTSRIEDLSNEEVSYVLEQLISRFENYVNRIEAGNREHQSTEERL